ncbi:MAG: chemotaxis protein CheC [Candidatus Aenigmatarchaeota archaeon]
MIDINIEEFSLIELDAIREIINIATAHSASALSKLLDKTILVKVPKVEVVPINKIPELLGGSELPIVGIYFNFSEELSGRIFLFFDKDTAETLVKYLTANITCFNSSEQEEINRSALMELGNILANSYLNAIAEMMNMKILLSVPYYASDMLGAVIDALLIEIAMVADYALLLNTVIESREVKISGNFLIFPDKESFEKMFKSIGLK